MNWIQKAIRRTGRCTPITKKGCSGAARRLALRFRKGGDIYRAAAAARVARRKARRRRLVAHRQVRGLVARRKARRPARRRTTLLH